MNAAEQEDDRTKPLFWIGGSLRDLRRFPEGVRRTMGFALWQAQEGGKHIDTKPLKGFGRAGVLEIVEDEDGSTFRTVYTVKLSDAIYVLHAFQKKSKKGVKTPKQELDLVRKRLRLAEEHHREWRRSQQDDGENQ